VLKVRVLMSEMGPAPELVPQPRDAAMTDREAEHGRANCVVV